MIIPKKNNLNKIHVLDLSTAFLEACFNPRTFQLVIVINLLGLSVILSYRALNKTEFAFYQKSPIKNFQENQSAES
jgi:hypothetical protein